MKGINIFQLMSEQYLNNRKNVVHYPYFRRNDTIDVKMDAYKIPRHKYTLLSIARNDTYGIDIYHHYFLSCYTKLYDQNKPGNNERLLETHVSQFFWLFVKIKALRNLVSINRNITGLIGMTVNQIFGPNPNESDKRLISLIKNQVSQLFQEENDKITKIKKGQYLSIAGYIENLIDKMLSDFYSKLQQPQFFQNLKRTQFLQENLTDIQQQRLIRRNLESIRNLQIYCKSLKKQIWQQFYNTHKGYMSLRIPIIMDSQRTIDNTLTLPKYTQQADNIMTKMLFYLNFKIPQQISAKFHIASLKLIKQTAQICSNYHKQTNKYYPSFSLDCIFFDQKKLVPVFSYSPILEDAVGIKRNTKNIQLMIATEPTPFFNIQQSYLQAIKENQIIQNRKYYSPIIKQKGEDAEGHIQNMKKQDEVMQKTHVWRLIQILYYIQNHRYFTNDYYNQKFSNNQTKDHHVQFPFYCSQYKKICQKAFEKIEEGQISISQIIPKKPTSKDRSASQTNQKFKFDLDSIKAYLNIHDEDDSLLQSLKFDKINTLINERLMLMKEFNILVLHPHFFKKMINPKKYYLIYFLHCFDQAFLKKIIRDKEKEIVQKELAQMEQLKSKKIRQEKDYYNFLFFDKKELVEQLQKYIFKASLSKEIEKRKTLKSDTMKKLSEYHVRKDLSGDYVRKQTEYYNSIFEIKSFFSIIQQYQSLLKNATLQQNCFQVLSYFLTINQEQFQEDLKLKQYIFQCKNINLQKKIKGGLNIQAEDLCIVIYKHINDKIQSNISTLFQKLKNIIIKFVTNEILQDFKIPQKIHDSSSSSKINKETWSAICNYKNTRFKVLIESLYYLDGSLLMSYKCYSHLLLEEAGGFEHKATKMQSKEIVAMTNNLLLFRKKILKLKNPGFIV